MPERRALLVGAALLLGLPLGVTACGGGGDDGTGATASTAVTWVALDGSARVPDDEGVVTELAEDLGSLVLDGARSYPIDETAQSFSTIDGSTQPLRRRLGQYVQIGLHDGEVVWLAGVASVLQQEGEAPTALYQGVVVAVDGQQVAFADGTVLTLADGLAPPVEDTAVLATIDVATHRVVTLAAL